MSLMKRFRSFFAAEMPPQPTVLTTQEADQIFLAGIAQLPVEEQQKQLQKRQWYKRLAQRQRIVEAEHKIELYDETGQPEYRV